MADGVRALRKLQVGLESPAGTAVAATAILRMLGVIEDTRVVTFPVEAVGNFGGSNRSYTASVGATLPTEGEDGGVELGEVRAELLLGDGADCPLQFVRQAHQS